MGPVRFFLGLSVLASAALYTQTAPTDVLGPVRSLEDDLDVNPSGIPPVDAALNKDAEIVAKRDNHEGITTDERFYRVYENGTIEFKTALSNGHIQYQRISNKVVNGKTIQVYEGYVSQRYADGRYGTNYYIADENGYRRTKVEIANTPPILPRSGPYAPDQQSAARRIDGDVPSESKSIPEEDEVSSEKPPNGSLAEEHVAKRRNPTETEWPNIAENSDKSSEDASLGRSTEKSALSVTDESIVESREDSNGSDLSTTEKSVSSTVEDDQTSTEVYSVKSNEDIETTPASPLNEENLSSSVENKTNQNEIITEQPTTEENIAKSNEDVEAPSTLSTNEGNLGETSTEIPTISDDISKTTENYEATEEIPTSEANTSSSLVDSGNISTELPSTEENIVKSSKDLEASTATEGNSNSFVEDDNSYDGISTDLPEDEANRSEDIEEKPANEANLTKSEEDDGFQSEFSTEQPLAEDKVVKSNEELEVSTELPATDSNVRSPAYNDESHIGKTVDTELNFEQQSGEQKIEENSNSHTYGNEPYSKYNNEVSSTTVKSSDGPEVSTELNTIEESTSSNIEDDHENITEVPATEANSIKLNGNTEAPVVPNTDSYPSPSTGDNEFSTVVPTTEESIVKSSDEENLEQSTELPKTEEVKRIDEAPFENEIGTSLPELSSTEDSLYRDQDVSTEVPELPTNHYNTDRAAESQSSTTEEIRTKWDFEDREAYTKLPELSPSYNDLGKTNEDEDIEMSTESATTEEGLIKSIEQSGADSQNTEDTASNSSSDDKLTEASTDASPAEESNSNSFENRDGAPNATPALEDNTNKSDEKQDSESETSTELTATIEDKYLEPITYSLHNYVTPYEQSKENDHQIGLNENNETSTDVSSLSASGDSSVKIDEEVDNLNESSTELSNATGTDKTLEESTEIPTKEEKPEKSIKDNEVQEGSTENLITESSDLLKSEESSTHAAEEISTEKPELPNLIDILTKKVEYTTQSTESNTTVTELSTEAAEEEDNNQYAPPALSIAEEILKKIIAGDKAQRESSTELPNPDETQANEEKNLEASTKLPALSATEDTLTKTDEDNEIPSDDVSKQSEEKNLGDLVPSEESESVTESYSHEQELQRSTELPPSTIPEDSYIRVHIGEPASLTSNVNETKTVIDRTNDLLAVEYTTGSSAQSSEEKALDSSPKAKDSSSSDKDAYNSIKKDLSKYKEGSEH